MKKIYKNEYIKRKFLQYLRRIKGYDSSTVHLQENAILLWQECHDSKDFDSFSIRQVEIFKQWLEERKTAKDSRLSLAYRYNILRSLRHFFEWLSAQSGYKSKVQPSILESLSLSIKENRIARQPNVRRIPSLKDIQKVVESIEVKSEIDSRDRALICFTLLTGARISAIYSLPMKAFEPSTLTVDQNPKFRVKTKFSKRILTTFFPIEYEAAVQYVLDWYKYLEKKGFKPEDPIFPQAIIENGKENLSFRNTGEVAPIFWSSPNSVREIFKKRFLDAKVPYYHPHTFRHLVVHECARLQLTEEQKKAISMNLGHEDTSTTFGNYGYYQLPEERYVELVKNLKIGRKRPNEQSEIDTEEIVRKFADYLKQEKE